MKYGRLYPSKVQPILSTGHSKLFLLVVLSQLLRAGVLYEPHPESELPPFWISENTYEDITSYEVLWRLTKCNSTPPQQKILHLQVVVFGSLVTLLVVGSTLNFRYSKTCLLYHVLQQHVIVSLIADVPYVCVIKSQPVL